MSTHLSARELLAKAESEARERVKAGKPAQLSPSTVINRAKSEATVYVYDAIGSWYGIDPKEWVLDFVDITAKTIHLRINSPGGSVFDAQAMRTAIAQHPSRVIAHVDGMAASAATTLAIAAREVEMTDGATFMIHNAWGLCMGGAEDMEAYAASLRKCTANIVADYQRKTGQSAARIQKWMDDETWFTAAEALHHGFVDRIFVPGQTSNAADPDRARRERALALAELQAKI